MESIRANSSRLELRRFEGAKELFLDVGASIATPAPVFSYARHAHHHRVALARLRVRCQGCGSFTPSCSISAGQATGCWTIGFGVARNGHLPLPRVPQLEANWPCNNTHRDASRTQFLISKDNTEYGVPVWRQQRKLHSLSFRAGF